METPRTRIELCGRLLVEIDGEGLQAALPGRQGRLLFAYLVLNRDRPVRRDELVDALWSENGQPESADALLRPPLSRLRKALGPDRLEGRTELTLALPDDAWIDWEVAHAALARTREALGAGDHQTAWQAANEAAEIASAGLPPGLGGGREAASCRGWRRTGSTSGGASSPTCGSRRSRRPPRPEPPWAAPIWRERSALRRQLWRPRRSASPPALRSWRCCGSAAPP